MVDVFVYVTSSQITNNLLLTHPCAEAFVVTLIVPRLEAEAVVHHGSHAPQVGLRSVQIMQVVCVMSIPTSHSARLPLTPSLRYLG